MALFISCLSTIFLLLFHINVLLFPGTAIKKKNALDFDPRNCNGGGGITGIAGHHVPNAKPTNAERQANPRPKMSQKKGCM
jgi:hypothetical protein